MSQPELKMFGLSWVMLAIALISGVIFAGGLFLMDIWHIYKSVPGLPLTEDLLASFTGASLAVCLASIVLYVVVPYK